MQTKDKERLCKVQKTILRTIIVITMLCAFFALINNITILKIEKNENTNPSILSQNDVNRDFAENLKICATGDKAYVKIGGRPIGISIGAGGLIVVEKSSVSTKSGELSPCKDVDIQKGDVVTKVNGESVDSIYKLKNILKNSKNGKFVLAVERNDGVKNLLVQGVKSKTDGEYKLGLLLKEDVGGVGTLTFVTKNGNFAALGHHIQDGDSNLSYGLDQGDIFNAEVTGVIKGERGKAGGLVAEVNRLSKSIGEIQSNTDIGLYGKYDAEYDGDLYRIALKGEAKVGKAQVLTTVDGTTPKFYDIDVVKVVSHSEASEKGMVISVRDKELLDKTGGIVQGMSGSPIVQNGVLIGAVTHVFVQDPTRGYAVHSRFMYDYANSLSTQSGFVIDDVNDVAA